MADPLHRPGRGAFSSPDDPYSRFQYGNVEPDGIDPEALEEEAPSTSYIRVHPKRIVQKVDSPDIGRCYSVNPYQGCEHGCIYCYARNSHPYWGYSAGLDFEEKVLIKEQAPELLEREMRDPDWERLPLMLSGNTDCYQPIEKEEGITRRLLERFDRFGQAISLVTKNRLVTRDIDILSRMAERGLVHVNLSITTLDKDTKRVLEPRTASPKLRLRTIEELRQAGIPVRVLIAPVIPSINGSELPELVEQVAGAGAQEVSMAMVRLNGQLPELFEEWLDQHYPDRKEKVLHQIAELHGGQVNDSRFGTRLKGEGALAASLHGLFRMARKKHLPEGGLPALDLERFDNGHGRQLGLFGDQNPKVTEPR
jgi:DNA repair photolyase